MNTPQSPPALVVPIEVFALPVGQGGRSVAQVAHNFDIEDPKPWLGQSTEPELFAVASVLHGGVHLHWALPDALTHGPLAFALDEDCWSRLGGQGFPQDLMTRLRDKPALRPPASFETRGKLEAALQAALEGEVEPGQQPRLKTWLSACVAGKMQFPVVPNRWRVLRFDLNQPDRVSRSWVIESDLLWTRTPGAADRQNALSPTVPRTPDKLSRDPWCLMGKVFPGDTWTEQAVDGGIRPRHRPHTALGYGHPGFAASLPHCYNVFGMYDPLDDAAGQSIGLGSEPARLAYAVIGWYSDGADDPAATRQHLPWDWPQAATADTPACTLCCGLLTDVRWSRTRSDTHEPGPIQVAVGNTTVEALSALLARQDKLHGMPGAEGHLNALQYGLLGQLDAARPGLLKAWDELLHRQDFGVTAGGTQWVLKHQTATVPHPGGADDAPGAAAQQIEGPMPEPLAAGLNELNDRQACCDAARRDLDARRSQLFADWCNYLVLRHDESLTTPAQASVRDDALNAIGPRFADTLEDIDLADAGLAQAMVKRDDQLRDLNLKLQALRDAEVGQRQDYRAQAVGAPRFWQCNEPVVLMCGDDARRAAPVLPMSGDNSNGRARLQCRLFDSHGASASVAAAALAAEFPARLLQGTAAVGDGGMVWVQAWSAPWRPLVMQWQVEFRAAADPTLDCDPAALLEPRGFDERHPNELHFAPEQHGNQADVYSGMALLAGNAEINVVEQAKAYLLSHAAAPANAERRTVREQLAALAALPSLPLLSQALGGFNAALLARRQTLQLPVFDPGAVAGEVAFGQQVAAAVGDRRDLAPLAGTRLNPLRSGHMQIKRLWLVDAFGQIVVVLGPTDIADLRNVHALEPGAIVRARSLVQSSRAAGPPAIALRPRLAQPARLQFRWISAADDQVETSSHPASSPVLGWVLANHLEHQLAVYGRDGTPLGSFNLQGALWQGAPGPLYEADIAQAVPAGHLRDFALGLKAGGKTYLAALIPAINDMTSHVLPDAHKQFQGASLLMGRPLALVRASLDLELLGPPAVDQSLQGFQRWLQDGAPRSTRGMDLLQVPVRLGHKGYLNDGLIGYFLEGNSKLASYQTFYVEAHAGGTGSGVVAPRLQDLTVVAAAAQRRLLTLLVDPRAPVHATTGILPVKQIEIPPQMVATAIRHLAVSFPVTPVFAPRTAPSATGIAFPVPAEPGFAWTFLRHGGAASDWPEAPVVMTDQRRDFSAHPQQLIDGWLQLRPQADKPEGPR